ncbi:hypothetical protein [Mycolicibacterium arenosum]|uniref:Secreted protein n=1 Tax=Mycolicibacterium arenosum TaxID=2952157 RepID=A0ABT1M3F6_9MYCO|nr:hypothetical protein [Mycolicibacterium sp. CAU 1645]MCP9273337.1 hypothetical protein [Mycolicibacterium sp. CAU 1645]
MSVVSALRSAAAWGGVLVMAASSMALAPSANANAEMRLGNYEVANNRWNDHTWIWSVTHSCGAPDCATFFVDPVINPETPNLNVIAIPRPPKSQRFQNTAFWADGRYTLTVDVIDGVRCIGYNLPSHDVYSWDAVSLAGTITSTYNAGCYGAPGGTSTYTFSLIPF